MQIRGPLVPQGRCPTGGGCLPAGPGKSTGRGDLPAEALSFWVRGGWSLQPRGCGAVGAGLLVPVSILPHTHTQLARTASVLLFAVELALGAGSSQWPFPRNPPGVWGTRRAGRPQALTPRIPCRPPPPPAWHHPPLIVWSRKVAAGPSGGDSPAGRPPCGQRCCEAPSAGAPRAGAAPSSAHL